MPDLVVRDDLSLFMAHDAVFLLLTDQYDLNCIEETPSRDKSEADGPAIDEKGNGTLFGPEEEGEIITPSKDKSKKGDNGKIRWTGIFRKKISAGLEGAFDNTVGGLFDSME